MNESNEIILDKIPITALREKTRLLLSKLLNSIKILATDDGLPRDWRGIAYLAGLQNEHNSIISMHDDSMYKVLQLWQNETGSFGNLINFLSVIDRWDVIDDIKESLNEDAKFHLTNKNQISQTVSNCSTTSNNKIDLDLNILTQDDVLRSKQGLPPQQYDALVIFADEDIDFATELIEKMEDYGLKICIKDRDLIGGTTFEHEAIMRLIAERCNRLIIIITEAFFKSSANTFFVNFGQALGIEQRRRKIIPCLYQNCILPAPLNTYFLLNYQRSNRYWNFWEKLRVSIQNTTIEAVRARAITAPLSIPDIINDEQSVKKIENDKYSTALPIKTPRKKHSIQNNVNTFSISKSVSENESISENCQTNSLHNSQSMIEFNTKNSINNKVQLSDDKKKPSTKTWYKKLLTSKLTSDPKETKATNKEGPKKRQWFKKKLISS